MAHVVESGFFVNLGNVFKFIVVLALGFFLGIFYAEKTRKDVVEVVGPSLVAPLNKVSLSGPAAPPLNKLPDNFAN